MKKISFTRLKIIGVIILERCQDLQIYLKFGFKSRTWIVLLNVRSRRVVHPRKKPIYGDFIQLVVLQIPTTIPFFQIFLTPPPQKKILTIIFFPVRESDYQPNMQLLMEHMRGSRIFFSKGRVLRIILLRELSNFECSMAAGGMSGLPDTPRPSRFVNGRKRSLYNKTVRRDKCYVHNLTCIKFSILHFFNRIKTHTK